MSTEAWIVLSVMLIAGWFALGWLFVHSQQPPRIKRDWKSYDPRFRRFL